MSYSLKPFLLHGIFLLLAFLFGLGLAMIWPKQEIEVENYSTRYANDALQAFGELGRRSGGLPLESLEALHGNWGKLEYYWNLSKARLLLKQGNSIVIWDHQTNKAWALYNDEFVAIDTTTQLARSLFTFKSIVIPWILPLRDWDFLSQTSELQVDTMDNNIVITTRLYFDAPSGGQVFSWQFNRGQGLKSCKVQPRHSKSFSVYFENREHLRHGQIIYPKFRINEKEIALQNNEAYFTFEEEVPYRTLMNQMDLAIYE